MLSVRNRIADIEFFTESDIQLSIFNNGSTNRYLSSKGKTDVSHFIHQLRIDELIMPSLTPCEVNQVRKCEILGVLGRGGGQILPLTIIHGQEDKFSPYLANNRDMFDFPILMAEGLRGRLSQCLQHAEKVLLILHPLTVEIRDYALNRIDIFFPDILAKELQNSISYNGMERMFRVFLPKFDAFMVHSSAVIRKNKVAFFLAPDEGGKTSVARQVPQTTVLGDDQVILRKQNGGLFAHSTPWGKIINDPISAPLGAFFILEKAKHFELTELKPIHAIDVLWEEHKYITMSMPKKYRLKAFQFIYDVAHSVPVYNMKTPKEVNWGQIDACF